MPTSEQQSIQTSEQQQQRHQQTPDLAREWSLLQNQFDSYEKFSLLIKLFALGVFFIAHFMQSIDYFIICLLAVLWLQDAIWKTFQARIEVRLIQLETYLSESLPATELTNTAYQFNRLYLQNRPSTFGLIMEYLQQAARPTIAFPHVLLVLMATITLFL